MGFSDALIRPKLNFVALAIPEKIAIGVLVGVANPQSWWRRRRGGRGWYRSKERLWGPV